MPLSNEELIQVYTRFDDHLKLSDAGSDIFRAFLFAPLKIMANLVNSLGNLMFQATEFLGFWSSSTIGGSTTSSSGILNNAPAGSLLEVLRPFQNFGVGVSILILGATYLLGKSEENKEVIKNIFFIIVIVGLLPSIMGNGLKIVKGTISDFTVEQGELGTSAIKSNTTDLYAFVDEGWSTPDLEKSNRIDDLIGVDINEIIEDPEEADDSGVLNHQIKASTTGTGKVVEELPEKSNNWIVGKLVNLLIPRYYRWSIDWIPAYITVIALLVAITLSLARLGRLGMESAVNYIFANLLAFFSFRDTTRLKQAVMQILIGFITILSIFVLFFVFIYYMAFVKSVTDSPWLQLFGIIGGCLLLYDGPSIIQQLFGVDAGLGAAGAMVITAGAGMAARLGTRAGRGVAMAGVSAGSFLTGMVQEGRENERTQKKEDNASIFRKPQEEKNQDSNFEEEAPTSANEKSGTPENPALSQAATTQEETAGSVSVEEEMETGKQEGRDTTEEKNSESPLTGMENKEKNSPGSSPDHPEAKKTGTETENQKQGSPIEKEAFDSEANKKTEPQKKNEASLTAEQLPKNKEEPAGKNAKPSNPLLTKADQDLKTPKAQRRQNLYSRFLESNALGKEYNQYLREKHAFKKHEKLKNKKRKEEGE